jgi:methyl-accepting chemotaxis protein
MALERSRMLRIFLTPAMAIMNRLRFTVKIGLVGALFLALVAGLSVFINGKLGAEIRSAEAERLGIPLLTPARHLMQAVQTHRGQSLFALSGDRGAKEKLQEVARNVDAKLNALSLLNKQFGESIGLADALEPIKRNGLI